MSIYDLTDLEWTLRGWRPYAWRLGRSIETEACLGAEYGPVPASVPGSVQHALYGAGLLPSWHVGLNANACQWVEHQHWQFSATLPGLEIQDGERVVLWAEGLDHSGWILFDGKAAAEFEGALLVHRIDVTKAFRDGSRPKRIDIVFDQPPDEQGQIGYTSRSHHFKPRYNYSWDWCPRFVPTGVSGRLQLMVGASAAFELRHVRPILDQDDRTGSISVSVDCDTPLQGELTLVLRDGDTVLRQCTTPVHMGTNTATLDGLDVQPWRPNGMGRAKTYVFEATVRNAKGDALWSHQGKTGFRRVAWQPCEGAAAEAAPWICVVNNRPVFLQGVNWTPIRLDYFDATREEYATLLDLYRDMGCNFLRVWGGAVLETETFYELCDERGLMVWQEFPLSSSGLDNCPPDDPPVIEKLRRIAHSYIRRRSHHPSLVLWGGGNELTYRADASNKGVERPADTNHPCLSVLEQLTADEDPDRRFVATSPTGPRFSASPNEFGKGVHHDVHGPWGMGGFENLDAWRAYWEADDALFRSEVGMPGASPESLIRRYAGDLEIWPPDTLYWKCTAAWWTQWDRYISELGGMPPTEALEAYIERTQRHQAEALAIAASSCKRRFPKCGGFVVWMGHDCFPCPANNSIIDFEHHPKPAYEALRTVFLAPSRPQFDEQGGRWFDNA
jgi:beta-mannosidase